MLGQGYDFPPITVAVPMRPYSSFAAFYQFVGRGIRVITHPALLGRVGPGEQFLDVIYDMDPLTAHEIPPDWDSAPVELQLPGTRAALACICQVTTHRNVSLSIHMLNLITHGGG